MGDPEASGIPASAHGGQSLDSAANLKSPVGLMLSSGAGSCNPRQCNNTQEVITERWGRARIPGRGRSLSRWNCWAEGGQFGVGLGWASESQALLVLGDFEVRSGRNGVCLTQGGP